jgi:hypothetical protein
LFAVRALSPSGDMQFGRGSSNFLRDTPEAVGQCVGTRLKLWQDEWYLDRLDGTAWFQQILGQGNVGLAQAVLEARILGTPFVTPAGLTDEAVTFSHATRAFSLSGVLATAFGEVTFSYPVNPAFVGPFTFTVGTSPLGGGNAPLG